MEEQTLVINDLLSFLTCKSTILARNDLFTAIRSYYTQDDIIEARNTLLASLPVTKSTRQARRVKRKDPLVELYECVHLVPESDLPMFVCRDLNNIPCLESDMIIQDSSSSDDDEDFDFKAEQNDMKTQIKRIASLASDLKRQLNNFMESSYDIPHSNVGVISSKRAPVSDDSSNHSEPSHLSSNAGEENPDENADLMSQDEVDYPDSLSELEGWEDKAGADDNTIREERVDIQPASHDADYTEKKLPDHLQDPQPEGIVCIKNDSLGVLDSQEMSQSDEKSIELSYEGQIVTSRDTLNPDSFEGISIEDFCQPDGVTHTVLEESSIVISIPGTNQCAICGEMFKTKPEHDWHMRTHMIENSFECILCDKSFNSRKYLRQHFVTCFKKTKDKLKDHICKVCGRMYGNDLALKQHSYLHCKSRPFACPQCCYRFLSKKAMDAHIRTIHNSLNKYACPFCDLSYISNGYLRSHIRTHTGEKPFECCICSYRASTRDLLKRHMKRHGPQEKVKCQICDFICYGTEKLNKHKILKHRKECIKCAFCEKKFRNASTYNRHYLMHTGEKPFKCPTCPYAGISNLVLKKHMKIHSGENPMHCPRCDVPFRTKYSLKRHLKTHSPLASDS